MYREPGMSKSQKRSATRANRSPSGRPEAKRLPDRRGPQDQARGTASAQSCRRFRLAHSEVAERIRAFDWASTDKGRVSDWSNDVQTAVTICAHIASAQQAEFAAALEVHTRRAAELSGKNEALHQPLMATITNSDTCLHWLASTDPDLGKTRAAAGSLASARSHLSMTALKTTATDHIRKISPPKAKSPKHARSVRITTDAQMRHGCAGQMLMARAVHLNRGST
jgi:hypothetical protein